MYTCVDVDTGKVEILNGDQYLRRNFKIKEFACNDGSKMILYSSITLDWLQAIRDIVGIPIEITSAYRTYSYNKSIDGAKQSQHMYGRAVDIKVPKGYTNYKLLSVVERVSGYICGIGKYDTFIHLDSRRESIRW